MSYPQMQFNTIQEWENYLNSNIVTNGTQDITGVKGNNAYNGAVKFVKRSPLNWAKVAVYSSGGAITLSNNFLGTAVFITTTPDSVSFDDNFYNQYVLSNMTANDIPLGTPTVYYDMNNIAIDHIPAKSTVVLLKADNDIWISAGGSATQKQPKTFVVGVTEDAPVEGATTWTLDAFQNSWVALFINGGMADFEDAGDGSPYITKSLGSKILTVGNYASGWAAGDKLNIILI